MSVVVTEQTRWEDVILRLVREERFLQDVRWGGPAHDDANRAADWVSIFARQLGLAAPENPAVPVDPAHWRRQMVRLAAVAFAALESDLRVNGYARTADHATEGNEGRTA